MNQSSTKKFIIASLLCAPFFFVACGDDITEEIEKSEIKTEENGVRWARPERQLVVTMSQTDENATRVVLVDGKYADPKSSGVKATWETTDKVGVWNSTAFADKQDGYNTVNPNSNTQHTNFVGTVNCSKGDKISLFYPYGNGTGVTTSSDGMLTLDLQSQNGTLEEISKKFDLVYGEATISSVSNGEASASLGTLTSGITILELQFQDTTKNNEQIEFEHLEIQVEGGHNMATLNLNKIADGLTMIGGNTFDIRPGKKFVAKVYVALFGETAGKTLRFSIIDKYGFQHQASAKAPTSVTAGQITRANLKAKDGKFIEFGGTKFAKGNLIWDEGRVETAAKGANGRYAQEYDLRRDSWFVAPSQEWSPEQLKNKTLGGFTPGWPAAAPKHQAGKDTIYTVPDPTDNNFYISTYILGLAGLNGATSGLGYVVRNTAPSGGNVTILTVQKDFAEDTPYRGLLWNNSYLDGPYTLSDALNFYNQTASFFGDQAYLATGGKYVLPTVEDLRKVFEHPNAVWAVYVVNRNGQDVAPMAGSKGIGVPANSDFYKQNPDLLPIYGLYVDKTRTYDQMKKNGTYTGTEWGDRKAIRQKAEYYAYKGCAVVLTKDDLKRGIFLPADGVRTVADSGGKFVPVIGFMGGEYCSYVTATFGKGALGTRNGRHWTARADNHGQFETWGDDGEPDVKIEFKNEFRTTTGSIRPVFVGDVFK